MRVYDAHYDVGKAGLKELAQGIRHGCITLAVGDTMVVRGITAFDYEEWEVTSVSEDGTLVYWKPISSNNKWSDSKWYIPMEQSTDYFVFDWFDPERCLSVFRPLKRTDDRLFSADGFWWKPEPFPWISEYQYSSYCRGTVPFPPLTTPRPLLFY